MKYQKIHNKKQAFFFGIGSILIIAVFIGLYFYTNIFGYAPIPIAKINNSFVWLPTYTEEYNAYEHFTLNVSNEPLDETSAKEQIISRLIINTLNNQKLAEYDVEITQEEIDQQVSDFMADRTPEEFFAQVKDVYGWSQDDFIERVVKPALVQQKLLDEARKDSEVIKNYTSDDMEYRASHIFIAKNQDEPGEDKKSEELLQEALKKINEGESFEDFAATINQDRSQETGGDIGWFRASEVDENFLAALQGLDNNELHDSIIQSKFGYHIVKKTDERTSLDLDSFMRDTIKEANISVYWGLPNPIAELDA